MQKKLTLSIPEPCHEDWNKMQPTDQGRFCLSCQKEVIDFSGMTDKELYNYFLNIHGSNVCGSMDPRQLNIPISKPVDPKKKKLWYINYLTALFLFINKSEVKAQIKAPVSNSPVPNQLLGKMAFVPAVPVSISIRVIDSSGNPISSVSAKIKGSSIGMKTNLDGYFILDAKVADDSFIEISSVAYKKKEISAAELRRAPVIILSQANIVLDEVIVVASSYSRRRMGMLMGSVSIVRQSLLQKVVDTVSGKNVFKIYPNPVERGSYVSIDMKGVKKGEYQFQVMNAAGAIVQYDRVTVPDKQFNFQLPVKAGISAGIYFLNVINPENKLLYKSKLVVM